MQLAELFNQLSLGVLSNLAIGGEGLGTIPAKSQPKLTMHVHNALTALYSRFNLLERELVIRVYDGLYDYPFEKKYADMDRTVGPKFIEDGPENIFTEDVFKVLAVYNNCWEEIVLNDPGDPTSLYTPNSSSLQVPMSTTGDSYHLLYQAKHPKLLWTAPVAMAQKILLPEILIPALEAHVAYQVFSPMNGAEHTAKAVEHLGRFEMLCLEVETKDFVTSSLVQTHTKLDDRGFV